MMTLHMVIRGRVQGVGFRSFVLRRAVDLGLTGWVRNRGDGSVEVQAEGTAAPLSKLRDWAASGPGSARVAEVEEEWGEGPGRFHAFEVTG